MASIAFSLSMRRRDVLERQTRWKCLFADGQSDQQDAVTIGDVGAFSIDRSS
jgi:hypothetical protein